MDDIVTRARQFAAEKHATQRRKYDDVPYMVHLDGVAGTLRDYGYDDPALLAAAYLHDTVEGTKTTIQEIHEQFGQEVAELVYWLSDAEKGRRKIRKLMSAWRLSRAPLKAKLIKLADFVDNTLSVNEHEPKFANVYLCEKAQTMGLMANVEGPALTELPLYLRALQADPKPEVPAHTDAKLSIASMG